MTEQKVVSQKPQKAKRTVALKEAEKLSKFMSEKDLDKVLAEALKEQTEIVETPIEERKTYKNFISQEEALASGGKFKIFLNSKTYSCSVFTEDMLRTYDNKEYLLEDGYEVDLPQIYKFSCKTPLGYYLMINAKTHTQAMEVATHLLGGAVYSVSASRF